MTDTELYQMLAQAEQQQRQAAEAEAYARGRHDALRELVKRLCAPAQPAQQPAEEPAEPTPASEA